jgi:large subunit ribosomal protein L6
MSRLGKLPIKLTDGTSAKFEANVLYIKGPKGELNLKIDPIVNLELSDKEIKLSVNDKSKKSKSFWGLFYALVRNMVIGVSQGFERKLEINGVGYRANLAGNTLKLNLGFSHPIDYELPEKIEANVEGNIITLSSIDKDLLGRVAHKIRSFRPPEPYKGKGIKYSDEIIRKKAGKTASKEA